jgi:hypothetical protein
MRMSAIKSGEKNVPKGDAPQEHPERGAALGAVWEKKNQGENRAGPGPQYNPPPNVNKSTSLKTDDDKKRYLLRR